MNYDMKQLQDEQKELQISLEGQKEQQKAMANENIELRQQIKQADKRVKKLEESDKVKDANIKTLVEEVTKQQQKCEELKE